MNLRFLVLIALGLATIAAKAEDWVVDGTFKVEGLLNGHEMTEAECQPAGNSLWLTVDGRGDCIRYFHAGLDESGPNRLVHIWLHGDRLSPRWSSRVGHGKPSNNEPVAYGDSDPAGLEASAKGIWRTFGVPYIRLSRPGTYGSSGDHKQRRRPREIELMHAAIEALKARYQIEYLALSGHSGGGHLVGALLPRRPDLRCAVIASGNVAPGQRIRLEGWSTDTTGYTDWVDPVLLVDDIPVLVTRPIILLADPRDQLIWFSSQQLYYQHLHQRGHKVVMFAAKAAGPDYHDLSYLGQNVVRWCLERRSDNEILSSTKFLIDIIKPGSKKYSRSRDAPSEVDRD